MICVNCHFENPEGIKFCGNCGTPQESLCSSCGFKNPPGFKFCGNCGTQILKNQGSALPQQPMTTPRPEKRTEAERRHLTVMFCDLVGSTALSSELDPEDLREIITEYQGVCQKVVARYEGHIAQYLGDGILVYFGYPAAHENDAHRSVSSGLGILEAVQQFNKRIEKSNGIRISVRIGIHTGHVVIGDMGSTGQTQQLALGATPNIAARLQGLAEPDTLIISADTYALVKRFFLCEDKGEHQVKGIPTPIKVYRVIHENVARSRFEASQDVSDQVTLVGRDDEVDQLVGLWEDAKQSKSHVVLLSGEPGVGKSRVLQALMSHVAADSHAWLNIQQCSPYHKGTAFYPLAEVLEHVVLQLTGDESSTEKISRLEGFLLQYGFALQEMVPLFASIMAVPLEGTAYQPTPFSVEQQKQRIIGAFITMCLELSSEHNLLLVFEDIQWIDPSSLDMITQLINQPPSLNILTILSFRPEFSPPWRMQPRIIPMSLSNLSRDAVKEIIVQISDGKRLPEELIEQIIQKTDGIPLFVEELTKMVLGSEMIREHHDHYELSGPISSLSIPSTLHDSLVARLDRMSHTKEIAQIGAAIGREFSYELINITSNMQEEAMRECLNQLVEAELLLQRGVPPKATFKFRHVLIRDAAYQSLLKSQQQSIHQRIALSLTKHLPGLAENHPEVVAHHFEQAKMYSEAVVYWTKAGDKVRQHLAYDETLNYIERGLALIQQIKKEEDCSKLELNLLIIQAPVLMMTEGFASVRFFQASCRMKELAVQLGDDMSLFRALRGVITYELFAGKADEALNYARDALTIAESLKVDDAIMEAHRLIGQTSIYVGELSLSLKSFDQSISLYEATDKDTMSRLIGADPEIFSLIQSSHVAWNLGYPDQAQERAKRALAKADELERSYSQALCLFLNSVVSTYCGYMKDTLHYSQSCIELSKEYGFTMFANEAKTFLGVGMVENGDTEAGFRMMHEAIEARIQHNLLSGIHLHVGALAAMCFKTGDIDTGLQAVDRAIALREKSDDQYFLSEIYRLKGEFLAAKSKKDHNEEIEKCLVKSIKIAKKQKAKSLELRSAMSMARLRKSQGKFDESLELVTNVYNWFKEGLETHDLLEAKNLMETLSVKTRSTG